MSGSAPSQNLIVAQNLYKKFGDQVVVSDMSFQAPAGEVFALLGPNGAGKTTTIRMILDIFKPDSGTLEVLGGPLNEARKNRIGYMPEERGLYPDMRVLECLVYLGVLKGLSRKVARHRAQSYLERLELGDQQRSKIKSLSRGMTQKVQVIAAVLHAPDVLIIDEPFANLDPLNSQLVRDIILELRDEGKAVIMTSHQMALVEALCGSIVLMHRGKIVLRGTLAEARRRFARNVLSVSGKGELPEGFPGIARIERRTASDWYFTLAPDTHAQDVLRALVGNKNFHLDRFEVAMPTLDEIFIQIVRESAV